MKLIRLNDLSQANPGDAVELIGLATATGARQSIPMPVSGCSFQGIANGTAGAFSATILVEVSNDNANWLTLGTISLSGTATTANTDGFSSSARWSWVRGNLSAISGTGASVSLLMGV